MVANCMLDAPETCTGFRRRFVVSVAWA